MDNLRRAIDRLYAAFARVPKPRRIDGCSCCISSDEIKTLLKNHPRTLTSAELGVYAANAFLTVDGDGYLHFLPRILEITATDPTWYPDPEVTGRAIRSTNPESWTAEQRAALDSYLVSMIDSAAANNQAAELDSWLCAIGRANLDVRPYLERVAHYPGAVLGYFERNAEALIRNRLQNAFWELPCPAHDAIVEWFYSPNIARIPLEAYGCTTLTRPG